MVICSATWCFFLEFVDINGLLLCLNNTHSKQDYAYVNGLGHCSRVDHSVLSVSLYECLTECSVNISPLNPSDQCVVKVSLEYGVHTGTVHLNKKG